jgi:hypothetical protein
MNRRLLLVYLGLFADVLAFWWKPLFNDTYIFPWDFRYVQLPLVSFLAEELHRGRFPLWDPFTYCGDPIFANIQASFFHPLVLAAAWLSAHTSLDSLPMILEWIVALQIVFAGIATFHLFRDMGAGTPSAFAGAIIFQTGGYFAVQTEHIGAVMAVCWMPLAWLAVLRLCRNPTPRWLAALAIALGMAVLGGFPQATMAVFQSTAVLSLVLVAHRMSRPRLIAVVAAGCVIGIGLAAVQFIPTSQVTSYSVAKYRADWLDAGGGLYWQSLVSLVMPDHYHLFNVAQFKGPGDLSFLYLYGSIAGLALALYSLATFRRGPRNPYASVLAVMLVFGGLWMLGDKTPIWRAIYPLLPTAVRIGIHPEYTFCNFTLPFAGLAALGLNLLPVKDGVRWAVAAVIAVDLFLVGSGRPMNCSSTLEEPGVTREAFDGSSDLLETLRRTVNRDVPPSRIDTMDASINWAECATLTRVPAANGSSPLGPENIVRLQMLALVHPGVRWGWYYQVENPDSPVLDIMNVKYLLVSPKAAEHLKDRPRYRHIASLPGNELFENLEALPRYFLAAKGRQATDDEIERSIREGKVDLRREAFTDRAITIPEARGQVRTLHYEPNWLELDVTADGDGFLVMSEAFYPGWRAWIDGRPTEIYRTDLAFRGVMVPSGEHRMRMEFHPPVFDVSRGVSAVALALVAALLLMRKRV